MTPEQLRLRDVWIEAENARTEAYKAFMAINKTAPLRRELDDAERIEKAAHEAYKRALQQQERQDSETPL